MEDPKKVALATVYLSLITTTSKLQEGRQLNFSATIHTNNRAIQARYLINTRASAKAFVNTQVVKQHKLPTIQLTKPRKLRLADDSASASYIIYMAQVKISFGDHTKECWALVTGLGGFKVILGMPWLELHNPQMNFSTRTMLFNSDHCMSNCLMYGKTAMVCSDLKQRKKLAH